LVIVESASIEEIFLKRGAVRLQRRDGEIGGAVNGVLELRLMTEKKMSVETGKRNQTKSRPFAKEG